MQKYYYSTKTLLELALGTFFYKKRHYTYVSHFFYPYRRPNPKSSNPLLIYADLYHPWKDEDEYDKFIITLRMNIRKGILAQQQEGLIESELSNELCDFVDTAPVQVFHPLVLRISSDKIGKTRLQTKNSGAKGSLEYLITDLTNDEFDVLFAEDCISQPGTLRIIKGCTGGEYLDSCEVLELLRNMRN